MSETTQRDGQDRARIDLQQYHEVQYWTQKLGVSKEDLERAVSAAGDQVIKVREHLHR